MSEFWNARLGGETPEGHRQWIIEAFGLEDRLFKRVVGRIFTSNDALEIVALHPDNREGPLDENQ